MNPSKNVTIKGFQNVFFHSLKYVFIEHLQYIQKSRNKPNNNLSSAWLQSSRDKKNDSPKYPWHTVGSVHQRAVRSLSWLSLLSGNLIPPTAGYFYISINIYFYFCFYTGQLWLLGNSSCQFFSQWHPSSIWSMSSAVTQFNKTQIWSKFSFPVLTSRKDTHS